MSEPVESYLTSTELWQELQLLFTPEQLELLCREYRQITTRGYGELTIRVDGDRVYIIPAASIAAGKVVGK